MGIFGPGKKNLEKQIEELNEKLSRINLTINQTKYLDLNKEIETLNKEKLFLQDKKINLEQEITILQNSLIYLQDINEMQSFGFYELKYNFENSSFYKAKLDTIISKQKEMVKAKAATNHSLTWTMDNDAKKGKEFILDTIKLILRAFNNECDNIISKVKFNNVDASDNKIQKVYTDLNKLTDMQRVSIKSSYLKLKQEELYLKYEYECKLQEEKEEQQAIKEQMREEAKAAKELEVARKKVEKEETHFSNAIKDLNIKIQNSSDKEKNVLLDKLKELEAKLAEIEKSKQDLVNREQNTRAGYVYVISNIGSFGENVYKIGMTRRLEPMDRVKELGDASVPFKFDVHAMIFSENAPTLENALHKKFENQSVNKINLRKEFFNVSLNEIKDEIEKNHNATIEFTMVAEAVEYRQSLSIEDKKNTTALSSNSISKSLLLKEISTKQNQALELIRDMLSKLTNKEYITYKINGDTFEVLHKDNSDNWICRLFLDKKGQKGIHIPDENKNAIIFNFDEIEDLKDIKHMLEDIVKRYL